MNNQGPAQAGPAQAGPAQAGPAQAGPAQAGRGPEYLTSDFRNWIVTKIMITLRKFLGLVEGPGLRAIVVRFEAATYSLSSSKHEYLQKISLKMLDLEARYDTLQRSTAAHGGQPPNPAAHGGQPPNPAAHAMQFHGSRP